jgi:TolA-binding protein
MPIMTRTNCLAVLLLTAMSGTAFAQNALGDGRALDANPGTQGPSNYQRPSLIDELRFRNSIATGNAPGGLSFRGDIGYRTAGEFTGELGSDSLFAFRRDSLYSGLAGMGIRGTDALQYQFALTTGSAPPQNLMGDLSYTRDTYTSTSSSLPRGGTMQTTQPLDLNREQQDLDPTGRALSAQTSITGLDAGSMMGTLRSSSIYNTTSTLQPSLLSVYSEGIDKRPVGLVASPLLGITPTPLVDSRDPNPLVARPANATEQTTNPNAMPTSRLTTAYDDLVDQMRERVQVMRETEQLNGTSKTIKPEETNDAWLVRQMEEIRRNLYGEQPKATEDPNNPEGQSGSTVQPAEGEDENQSPTTPLINVPDTGESPASKRVNESQEMLKDMNKQFELQQNPGDIAVDPQTLEVLRGNASKEVKQLLRPGAESNDLYARHIQVGQQLIENSRYFEAEERFTRALSMKPRDVISQVGRLNAQIGAGMLLSASVNLQSLYSEHPELITTRYSVGVLPNAERVEELKTRLRESAGIIEPKIRTRPQEGDRVRVSAGLLLAYLGYQSSDQSAIDEGIDVVETLGAPSDRRFASLLKQLWLPIDTTPTP